jgi:hypothetical protein
MIGAENGNVFLCNKKAKNPSEKITHIFPVSLSFSDTRSMKLM